VVGEVRVDAFVEGSGNLVTSWAVGIKRSLWNVCIIQVSLETQTSALVTHTEI